MTLHFTEQDRQVIHSDAYRILLNAGPGTGKTNDNGCYALKRASTIINTKHRDAQVLLFSLTNNAADNARKRLHELIIDPIVQQEIGPFRNPEEVLRRIRCCTVHSFAFSQLRQFPWGNHAWDVRDSRFVEGVLNRAVRNLGVKEEIEDAIGEFIMDIYDRVCGFGSTVQRLLETEYEHLAPWSPEIHDILQEMDRLKRSEHIITFDDMIYRFHDHLQTGLVQDLHQNYPVIIVDEFQDTLGLQWEIVWMMTGEETRLLCAGDDGQTIFPWAGASFHRFEDFKRVYPDHKALQLTRNRRSPSSITGLSDALLTLSPYATRRNTDAVEDGEKVNIVLDADEEVLAKWAVRRIQELRAEGMSYNDMTVLYRFYMDSGKMREQLYKAGIPFKVLGDKSKRDRPIVTALFALIRVMEGEGFDERAWKALLLELKGVGSRRVSQILDWLKSRRPGETKFPHEYTFTEPLMELLEFVNSVKSGRFDNTQKLNMGMKYLQRVSKRCGSIKDHIRPTLLLLAQECLSLLDIIPKYNDPSYPLFYPPCENPPYPDEYVTLSSVHRFKGSESKAVFFIGTNNHLFDRYGSFKNIESREHELQLMNVAVTRARERLHLLFPIDQQTWKETVLAGNPWFFIKQALKLKGVWGGCRILAKR